MKKGFFMILGALTFASATYAKPITLQAVSDFPTLGKGEAPFYKDTRSRALAINVGNPNFRDKWAQAETTFTEIAGTYTITITTLTETDGESIYRLLVNGVEAGTFQNPESQKDYIPIQHTWAGIHLEPGTILSVESKAHTNGKIPERGGTAWARGRWRSLTITLANQPVVAGIDQAQ